jgi:hypothetical protein
VEERDIVEEEQQTMAKRNVLIMVHGMTPEPDPGDHIDEYEKFRKKLNSRQPRLRDEIDAQIGVEWGHEPRTVPPGGVGPDQRITAAENAIKERVSFDKVRKDRSRDNHLLPGFGELFSRVLTRNLTTPIKERVLLLGVTDAFYYCAPDGEKAVRNTVYGQILKGLQPFEADEQVRLHVIAISLGVTVAFDFLFGLFAPSSHWEKDKPDFVRETEDPSQAKAYTEWRKRAQDGALILASKSSMASQIPLLVMRKQKLVDGLALTPPQLLDPTVISVPKDGQPRWKLFYDVDDILAFPTRRLFDARGTIQEYQVDTDWRPDLAHTRYWKNEIVQKETADLIVQNL